jgi:hypothetical protein
VNPPPLHRAALLPRLLHRLPAHVELRVGLSLAYRAADEAGAAIATSAA